MRDSGVLLEAFAAVADRFVLFQGAADPHPAEGIVEPLARMHKRIGLHSIASADIRHGWKNMPLQSFMSCYFKS